MLTNVAGYTLVPVVAALLGAAIALYRKPGPLLSSAIQHFAAGVVFAAAASEVLPSLKHEGAFWPVAIGGSLGVLAMLLLRRSANATTARLAL